MSSKNNPRKVTLGMIKGKSITTSVPSIRYHASDDELEELYPSSDEEKQAPESEKPSPKCSPFKCIKGKFGDSETFEGSLERRSASMDENLSEGTSPSDPWKMLSDIRGKITKTFEEKLSEIKSEKKKKKKRRNRDTSSHSDSENLGDLTPTEESISEIQERESFSPILRRRTHSSRFVGFYEIETGIKTKNLDEKCVESGVEAAEHFEDLEDSANVLKQKIRKDFSISRIGSVLKEFCLNVIKAASSEPSDSEQIFSRLLNILFYHLFISLFVLLGLYLIPLSELTKGACLGLFVSFVYRKMSGRVKKILTTLPKKKEFPVLEIPAVEEHAVLERFEGWLNELPYSYRPENYHVARTKSVFFRLEGEILRVMETKTRIPKRAIWDEPNHKAKFTKKRVYSLAGSTVELLPSGLIRRRRWSKKYPICITFGKDALIESTHQKYFSDDEMQQTETENDKIIMEEDETDDDLSQSKDIKDVFEDSREEIEYVKHKIFVFARTDRQKEDWFRRLSLSADLGSKRSSISSAKELTLSINSSPVTSANETKNSAASSVFSEMPPEMSYHSYMTRYTDNQTTPTLESIPSPVANDGAWVNALIGRIIFDMHKCPDTINLIQDKIQRKLSNIKLPYFMESLHVSELVMGQGAPIIHSSTKPLLDERGLWFDLNISYEGCLTMTIETKLNLMKLKRAGSVSTNSNSNDVLDLEKTKPARSPMFDSDVEDSPETSTEDEDNTQFAASSASREFTPTQSSGRKFLSMMDKLAASKYFQSATELSYVRRAMEGVSNTEIRLMVSVSSIYGCLAVNIPPPPADRLWYGFKPVPRISLTAKPAVGEKTFNIVYVTKWIETKLLREFEKIVVIPNMDDLVIPLCPNYPYDC